MGLFNLKEMLFFYEIIWISCSSASQSFSYKDTVLTGSVIKTFLNIDWFQCLEHCYSTPECLSYNFCTGTTNTGNCELNRCGVDAVKLCGKDKALRYQKHCVFHHFKENQPREGCTTVSHQGQNEESMVIGNFTCSGRFMSIYADGDPTHIITREGESKPAVLLSCPSIVHHVSLQLPRDTRVISIEVYQRPADQDSAYPTIIGGFSDGLVTNREWKCANEVVSDEWRLPSFNDSSWPYAKVMSAKRDDADEEDIPDEGIPDSAKWITYADFTKKSLCRIKRKS